MHVRHTSLAIRWLVRTSACALLMISPTTVSQEAETSDVAQETESSAPQATEASTLEETQTVAAPQIGEKIVGDAVRGRELVSTCAACHGPDGNAQIPDSPNLAGQNEAYTLRQLKLLKSGERDAPTMAGQLNNSSEQDLADMAAYYASLPGKIGQASPKDLELGESIYRGGVMSKGVAACTSCHAPNGQGNHLAGFPRISGQPVSYTVNQLKAYREGHRVTDENVSGMMRDVAANLNDTEMEAVANYVLGLY